MEEEIYHAELADVKRETNILNGLAGTTVAVAIVFLMLGISLGEIAEKNSSESEEDYGLRVPVWERGSLNYITDQNNSSVLEFGPYELQKLRTIGTQPTYSLNTNYLLKREVQLLTG